MKTVMIFSVLVTSFAYGLNLFSDDYNALLLGAYVDLALFGLAVSVHGWNFWIRSKTYRWSLVILGAIITLAALTFYLRFVSQNEDITDLQIKICTIGCSLFCFFIWEITVFHMRGMHERIPKKFLDWFK